MLKFVKDFFSLLRLSFFAVALLFVVPAQSQEVDYSSDLAALSSQLEELITLISSIDSSWSSENTQSLIKALFQGANPNRSSWLGQIYSALTILSSANSYSPIVSGYGEWLERYYNQVLSSWNNYGNLTVWQLGFAQDYEFYNFSAIPFFQQVTNTLDSACLYITNNMAYYYPEFLGSLSGSTNLLSQIYDQLSVISTRTQVDYSPALTDIKSNLSSLENTTSSGFNSVVSALQTLQSSFPDYSGYLTGIETTLGRIDFYTALIQGTCAHLEACLNGGTMNVTVAAMPDVTISNPTDLTTVQNLLTSISSTLSSLNIPDHDYSDTLSSINTTVSSIDSYINGLSNSVSHISDDFQYYTSPDSLDYVGASFGDLYDPLTASSTLLSFGGNPLEDAVDMLFAQIKQGEYRRIQLDFIASNVCEILKAVSADSQAESYTNSVNASIDELASKSSEIDSSLSSVKNQLTVNSVNLSTVKSQVLSFSSSLGSVGFDSLPANIFLFKIPSVSITSNNGWQLDTENGTSINLNPYQDGINTIFTYVRYFFTIVWWSLAVLFLIGLSVFGFKFARAVVMIVFGVPAEFQDNDKMHNSFWGQL